LASQGWQVRADRDALSLRDLMWIASGAALGSLVVPPVGTVAAALGALSWRRRGLRPNLRTALPPVQATLPAPDSVGAQEHGVAAGLALLALALSLALWPPAIVPVALFLVVLGWVAWRDRAPSVAERTRRSRVQTALLEASVALDRARPGLDRQLALQGELVALERDWEAGSVEGEVVLERLERLIEELHLAREDAT